MTKMWVSQSGTFQEVKEAYVSENGVFKKTNKAYVSSSGDFKDVSTDAGRPILKSYIVSNGPAPHAEINVAWTIESSLFNADNGDVVQISCKEIGLDKQKKAAAVATSTLLSGNTLVVVSEPQTTYSVTITVKIGGVTYIPEYSAPGVTVVYAQSRDADTFAPDTNTASSNTVIYNPHIKFIQTSRTPAVTAPFASSDPTNAYLQWRVPSRVDNHWVRWLDPNTFADIGGTWAGAGTTGEIFRYSKPYPQNTRWAAEVIAVRGRSWSVPVRMTGTTTKNYATGPVVIECLDRRTWVRGNDKVRRGYHHDDNTWVYCGDDGKWGDYGTQVAAFYYWSPWFPNYNPFNGLITEINKGARIVRFAIWIERGAGGFNYEIPFLYKTHKHKWAHVNNNNDLPMHDNQRRSPTKLAAWKSGWVEMDPSMAYTLIDNAGNGMALGDTTNAKDFYTNIRKNASGHLLFVLD